MTDADAKRFVESLRCKPRFPWAMIVHGLVVASILVPCVMLLIEFWQLVSFSDQFVTVFWGAFAGTAAVLAVVSAVGFYFTKDW